MTATAGPNTWSITNKRESYNRAFLLNAAMMIPTHIEAHNNSFWQPGCFPAKTSAAARSPNTCSRWVNQSRYWNYGWCYQLCYTWENVFLKSTSKYETYLTLSAGLCWTTTSPMLCLFWTHSWSTGTNTTMKQSKYQQTLLQFSVYLASLSVHRTSTVVWHNM